LNVIGVGANTFKRLLTHLKWAYLPPKAARRAPTPLLRELQLDPGIPTGCSQASTFGNGSKISFYSATPGTSLALINCKCNDTVSCPSTLFQPNPRAAG